MYDLEAVLKEGVAANLSDLGYTGPAPQSLDPGMISLEVGVNPEVVTPLVDVGGPGDRPLSHCRCCRSGEVRRAPGVGDGVVLHGFDQDVGRAVEAAGLLVEEGEGHDAVEERLAVLAGVKHRYFPRTAVDSAYFLVGTSTGEYRMTTRDAGFFASGLATREKLDFDRMVPAAAYDHMVGEADKAHDMLESAFGSLESTNEQLVSTDEKLAQLRIACIGLLEAWVLFSPEDDDVDHDHFGDVLNAVEDITKVLAP